MGTWIDLEATGLGIPGKTFSIQTVLNLAKTGGKPSRGQVEELVRVIKAKRPELKDGLIILSVVPHEARGYVYVTCCHPSFPRFMHGLHKSKVLLTPCPVCKKDILDDFCAVRYSNPLYEDQVCSPECMDKPTTLKTEQSKSARVDDFKWGCEVTLETVMPVEIGVVKGLTGKLVPAEPGEKPDGYITLRGPYRELKIEQPKFSSLEETPPQSIWTPLVQEGDCWRKAKEGEDYTALLLPRRYAGPDGIVDTDFTDAGMTAWVVNFTLGESHKAPEKEEVK